MIVCKVQSSKQIVVVKLPALTRQKKPGTNKTLDSHNLMMKLLDVNYDERIFGLDIFRAIAILLIVAGHGRLVVHDLFSSWPSIPIIDGVELFFVLSGFLIGSILIKQMNSPEGLKIRSLLSFWKRRWFRTLPNYYLILLVNIFLVRYEIISGNFEQFNYKFFLFVQNFSTGFVGFFWESWSLSIEEWFYIIFPATLLLTSYFLPKKQALFLSIFILITAPLIYRIGISDIKVDAFWWDVKFRKVVLTRLDAIIYGVLAAYIRYYFPGFWRKSRNWMFVLGIVVIYVNFFIPRHPNDFYSKTFAFTVTSFGAALLLSKADSIKNFNYAWLGKSVTFISIISYSMYLVNLALVAQVMENNLSPESNSEEVIHYTVYWIITIAISTLLYKYYESPMTKLRDKF